jgi:hypothetical protein
MELDQIISGHIKELLNQEQDLFNERIKVCRECKLLTKDRILGEICDKHKWINPKTGELSLIQIDGYINGCNCRIMAKTRVPEAHCPLKKW